MRVLRFTLWTGPNQPGQIAVVRDCDTSDTLESERVKLVEKMNRAGAYVSTEIFEMEDGDEVAATLEAGKGTRAAEQTERHQSVMYYWAVQHQFPLLKEGAIMMSDQPAPLTSPQIHEVFEQLTRHPDYKGYGWVIPDKDGEIISLSSAEPEMPKKLALGLAKLRLDHPAADIKFDVEEGPRGHLKGRIDDKSGSWRFVITPEGEIKKRPL